MTGRTRGDPRGVGSSLPERFRRLEDRLSPGKSILSKRTRGPPGRSDETPPAPPSQIGRPRQPPSPVALRRRPADRGVLPSARTRDSRSGSRPRLATIHESVASLIQPIMPLATRRSCPRLRCSERRGRLGRIRRAGCDLVVQHFFVPSKMRCIPLSGRVTTCLPCRRPRGGPWQLAQLSGVPRRS